MSWIDGKTVLVTGATSGIGLQTAVDLAGLGARVVMVGRDAGKTASKLEEVRRRSGSTTVESLLCDLSAQADIRRLAETFSERFQELHVLINNAGVLVAERRLTVDGIETTFAVNHLAYFLLTNLLLDTLRGCAPARIVNVSSGAHAAGTIDFDDLGLEHGYEMWRAYCRSKLANVLFTRELARRLEGTGVTANSLHPGTVATAIFAGGGIEDPAGMLSPEEGARTSVYLATSPDVDGVSGQYFHLSRPAPTAPLAQDDDLARRLWDECERLTQPTLVGQAR